MPETAIKLLSASGVETVRQLGINVIRDVVFDVLTGKNVRSVTEGLTRRRIASLNLALVSLFVKGASSDPDFVRKLPDLAVQAVTDKEVSTEERTLAQWMLGLTKKSYENVLRGNPELLAEYRDVYVEACHEVIDKYQAQHGELTGVLGNEVDGQAQLGWLMLLYLMNTVGSQTLATRGSDKSAYGKLFEKLILGSLLYILDFEYIRRDNLQTPEKVYWLSSRDDDERESDATLLYSGGKAVRFDLGFIGRGNPEITSDKTTRYRQRAAIAGADYYIATIIIVDRLGERSRVEEFAAQVQGGRIVQMSAAYWPRQVAQILFEVLGYKHRLKDMNPDEIEEFLRNKLLTAPLESFIGLAT